MRCNSMPLIFLLMLNGFLLYKSGLLHVILRRHLKKIETSAKETRNVKGDLPSQNAATNAAAGDNNRIVTKHENNQRHGSKKNIIAMSLFGISPTYPVGVDRNIDLMMKFFPDWIIRVYIEKFDGRSRYGQMPNMEPFVYIMQSKGVEVFEVDSAKTDIPPVLWRNLVMDDPEVDTFIIRDSHTRLSARDFRAVSHWLKSGKALNCIRDHISLKKTAIKGGLWGGKRPALAQLLGGKSMFKLLNDYASQGTTSEEDFLRSYVYDKVGGDNIYCSDRVSCKDWPGSHPFPMEKGELHVGVKYDTGDGLLTTIANDANGPLNADCDHTNS